jgi:beta-N-acetylhexosaminidase
MILANKDRPDPQSVAQWSIEDRVGQLLVVGYRDLKQIQELKPGGVVLFSWSLKGGPEGTRKLIGSIRKEARDHLPAPLFISTDQEGGKVLRISKGMTRFPDAAAVGAIEDPYTAFRIGRSMGVELASLGLNMNFAPVLDLGNARSFLENRIWGDEPKRIVKSAVAFIRGLETSRILAVPKHFPGHGGTLVDSHHGLPRILKTFDELLKEDLVPFESAVNQGVLAVMSAHVEIPSVDRGPASLSKKFLSEILRDEIGFKGVIITDDLEMSGAEMGTQMDEVELALKALEAGNDQILIVWSRSKQKKIFNGIVKAVKSGRLKENWLNEKVARIQWVKNQFLNPFSDEMENPFWKENLRLPSSLELVEQVDQKAIRWLVGNQGEIIQQLSQNWGHSWAVFVPNEFSKTRWAHFRSKDTVEILPQKDSGKSLETALMSKLEEAVNRDIPTIIMTPPRAVMDESLFNKIVSVLATRTRSAKLHGAVLWAHQGLQPLEIKWKPEKYKIGIVSLYSTSLGSLEAFQDFLKTGTR